MRSLCMPISSGSTLREPIKVGRGLKPVNAYAIFFHRGQVERFRPRALVRHPPGRSRGGRSEARHRGEARRVGGEVCRPPFFSFPCLVPKLCLGTQVGKLCFASRTRGTDVTFSRASPAKQSFADRRSQAELGNEGSAPQSVIEPGPSPCLRRSDPSTVPAQCEACQCVLAQALEHPRHDRTGRD